MKFALFVLALAGLLPTAAQVSEYQVPKYPRKFKVRTWESGPKPGSRTGVGDGVTTEYTRIYFEPAEMRMLARTECGSSLGNGLLIERAKSTTKAGGQVSQIDWEAVRTEKVSFYAVMHTGRTILKVRLQAKAGRWAVIDKSKRQDEDWHVARLSFSPGFSSCIVEKEMTANIFRAAVFNALNNITLKHYRNFDN